MNYTKEMLENDRVKFTVDVDSEQWKAALQEAYVKERGKYQVDGFRKGHAPRAFIERLYGPQVFFDEALDIILPKTYDEILYKETDLFPVDRPEVSITAITDSTLQYTAEVQLKPTVTLGAYTGIEFQKEKVKVTKEEVSEEINKARENAGWWEQVTDRPAQMGDKVKIDYAGSVDGVAFEGGTAADYDLELGSGTFIPGFEDQLVGVKAGEEKDVVVTFPEDYGATELQGKEAVFACKINAVKKEELPALDDEFAKDVSECDTLADYKAEVKARLTREAEDRADREYEDAVVKSVVDGAEVDIPEVMIDNEVEDMIDEFSRRIGVQGIKLEDYLGYVGMTREQLAAEYKVQAKVSVKTRLVMEEIVKREEMKFEEAELEAKIAEYAERYGRSADELKKDGGSEFMNHVANQVLSEKLMDMLKAENAAAPKASKAKKEEKAEDAEPKAEKPAKKAPAKKAAADDKAEKPAKKAPAKKASAGKTDGEN